MRAEVPQRSTSLLLDEATRTVHREIVLTGGDHASRFTPSAIRDRVHACAPLLTPHETATVCERVTQMLVGLGPLEPLLGDPAITEVMINGPGRVWVERGGQVEPSEVVIDADTVRLVIDRILTPLGLRVDRTAPFVDARLADGSRVNIAVAPLALDGPYVTIRRFRSHALQISDFCIASVAAILVDAVRDRKNLIVSGGTGSGKTSLLNALAAAIEPGERVITIEDAAELRLPGEHTVRLEARPPNAEGVGQITIRTLVRNALRMRPDRLIIGEVRGAEAFDLMQAMNTGHDGSMSTCHANSPLDALGRIEAMALMADVGVPLEVLQGHLRSAVDLVVHMARGHGGTRQVEHVYASSGTWLVRDTGVVAVDEKRSP